MDLKQILNKGTPHAKKRRIGRGIGSGSGKTSGRGHKGRNSRSGSSRRPGYEGGQMPIYRRVPKRGFTNAVFRKDYTIINVEQLNGLENGLTVDLSSILEHGLVSMNTPLLKVLGGGELERKLTVRAQKFSKSARAKIEAAGGSVVELDDKGRETADAASAEAAPAEEPARAEEPAAEPAAEAEAPESSEASDEGEETK